MCNPTNYRDLGVQQLGSIYERLLEQEIVRDGSGITVRPNVFARKGSGSYYTPDDLVGLLVKETIEPLIQSRVDAFRSEDFRIRREPIAQGSRRIERLKQLDPAEKLLELKVCDPAMGSGHFLVNLVDHLADRVITAMAEAEASVDDYISPLTERIDTIRNTINDNANKSGWTITDQLDDRHIVRRMVLKRCVYGVDKNPMAVELAKVALWLHTFTVGAPLSFLDHHLRCGDSLFGSWVRTGIDKAMQHGAPLFLDGPLKRAMRSASPMQIIEGLTDAEIAEAHHSEEVFVEIEEMTMPLNSFLSLVHAFDWLNLSNQDDKVLLYNYYLGMFGDPIDIASGKTEVLKKARNSKRFVRLLDKARQLLDKERFFNWQVSFPGVWTAWESAELNGGFDAVISNPPWEKMKLQQVEWFAARRPEIAMTLLAADRKRMIADLEKAGDPLARDFANANDRTTAAVRMARRSDDYPLLSSGDVNLYSLFVERAMTLVKPDSMVGLPTPSGIASDKTAARFFKGVATEGRLRAFYDF